jgi:predicted DCC family thiol-disulfide oxidoreductase YuxK
MFFDGACPLCRREVDHYRRLDRDNRVDWVDISVDRQALQALGITADAAMRRLHAVDRQGRLRVGVPAFVAIWEALPFYRRLAPLLRLPGLLPLLDIGYRRFADWRLRRRCSDGQCPIN